MSNQTLPSSTDLEIDEFHGSAFSERILSVREALLPIYMFLLSQQDQARQKPDHKYVKI